MNVVGRTAERAALLGALTAVAADGRSRVAVVTGEPGIGKTTLLRELEDADVPRLLVLAGRAAEFERSLPFGAIADALEPHVAGLDARATERLAAGLDAAAAAVPDLFPGAPAADRYLLHRAVRTLLERLAAGRTLALVLDDVQWADPATAELLAALLRRPPDAAVLLVLATRPTTLPDALTRELSLAERDGRATAITLGPLSRDEAAALVDDPARYDEAGGNPFYLLQLARTAPAGAPAGPQRAAGAALDTVVPPAVAAALAAEVGALSTLAQAVAQAAAVAGEPFDFALVAAIAGVPEEDVLEALDELSAADLVRADPSATTFRFRHPLVRRGVYGSIVGGWRVTAHRRADAALAARGVGAAGRAHHVERSSVAGDVHAAALLLEAADEAQISAPALSIAWRTAAVERLPEVGPGSERRAAELPRLADALAHAGRLAESLAVLERAPATAAVAAAAARVERLLGRTDAAAARLDAALRSAADPADVVRLEVQRSAVARARADTETLLAAAQQALTAARTADDPVLRAAAAAQLAVAQAVRGTAPDALDDVEAAIAHLDDRGLAAAADELSNAAWASWYAGRFTTADALTARSVAAAAGRVDVLLELLTTRLLTVLSLNRIPEAVELGEAALENAQLLGNPAAEAGAHIGRCLALLPAGDLAGAIAAGETALALADRVGSATLISAAAWPLADALNEAGRHRQAIDLILGRMGGPDLPGYLPVMLPTVYAVLTASAVADGARDEARDWAARAQAAAAPLPAGVDRAQGLRAAAEAGLADDPAGLLREAIDACLADGARHEALRARLLLGMAGDTAELDAVVAEARESGNRLLHGKAVRALRAAGRRVAQPRRASDGALSAREREIAELVAERLTNREIAARLFLSEKTVETHLSNVFAKLGVRRRTEVAAALGGP